MQGHILHTLQHIKLGERQAHAVVNFLSVWLGPHRWLSAWVRCSPGHGHNYGCPSTPHSPRSPQPCPAPCCLWAVEEALGCPSHVVRPFPLSLPVSLVGQGSFSPYGTDVKTEAQRCASACYRDVTGKGLERGLLTPCPGCFPGAGWCGPRAGGWE